MAPLISLFALFALLSTVIASPHIGRHVYNHANRAVVHPNLVLEHRDSLPLPKRKRSLNKRCVPRPSNTTTSAVPTSTAPATTAPVNVAPVPSLQTYSPSPSPSTSSTPAYQAPSPPPTTSSTPAPAPTTSSTPPAAQTSSSSSSSSSSGFLSGVQSGQGTYYNTGLGACGITNNNNQDIVAVGWQLFDNYPGNNGNPNDNPVCNKQIKATYQGKSVVVTVTDRCTGCQETDLDMSPNAFDQLADASVGRINLTWEWA